MGLDPYEPQRYLCNGLADLSRLNTGKAFRLAEDRFDKITPGINKGDEPLLAEHAPYEYFTDIDEFGHRNSTLTAISLLVRSYMGHDILL